MSGTDLYDSLQIASNFMEQAKKLADSSEFEAAFTALNKAKSYAFNNDDLLDDIQLRYETIRNAQRHYIRQLEEEAANLFNREPFDSQKARETLLTLRRQDSENEIAQSLWEELQAKEAAERESRLVKEFQQQLENIWQQARELERIGEGAKALAEYERAIVEASKKVGDSPEVIPLQSLKLAAVEKRDQAKEKWEEIPKLILAHKWSELIEFYERLHSRGETETEFFDEQGKFTGTLPIEQCIDQTKQLAACFAEQQVQDYLYQARELLAESPRAAYEIIQEALSNSYPDSSAKSELEKELKEKIQPALDRREKAIALLNGALSKENAVEAWTALDQVEQIDPFTPGLADARQRLASTLEQQLVQLLDAGRQFQDLEDFETAQGRFNQALHIGQCVGDYNDVLKELHTQAQEVLDKCLRMQQKVVEFDQQLAEIAELNKTEPEQANEALEELKQRCLSEEAGLSEQAITKIERLQVQIDFRLGVDRLYNSLELKTLAATDPVDLISIEEGAKKAVQDYPDEARFPRLIKRIVARRSFLKGSALCKDPEQYVEAMELLQQVIDLEGDDAKTAQNLLERIETNEQQEADIAIAIEEASQALENNDPRSAFLLLQPFRYAASRQAAKVRELISTSTTSWRNDIEQQLEALIAEETLSLPKVEFLMRELERTQSPRVAEWRVKALAPAYATTATDLQELDRWDEAVLLWEEAFRLAPKVPGIVEGRRNAHRHQALARAQTTTDPVEKEQLLNDLNRAYSNDPTVKRYLAAFYYSQKRYAEARIALSQAKLLLQHTGGSKSEGDTEAIRHMEKSIEEAEVLEKAKSAIRGQLKGKTTVNGLKDARLAYEALEKNAPDYASRLQRWWEGATEPIVNELKESVAEISEQAGMAWERAELLCKIVALRSNPQTQDQARRMYNLACEQIPTDIKLIVENPEGVGYGPPGEALDNHIAAAKALYERIVEMTHLERALTELGLQMTNHKVDLNDALYQLELALEKLYFTQEKQLEIKNQLVVALVIGKWGQIEDSLKELELKGWSQHREVKGLIEEVEQAKRKRSNVETAIRQLKEVLAQEAFEKVQERLEYIRSEDSLDETQLQATLDVVDPCTGEKIKGPEALAEIIPEKLAVATKLDQWQAESQKSLNWPIARTKISKYAGQGEFTLALELIKAALGQNENHPLLLQDEVWSLERLRQYLESFPLSPDELNSCRAKTLFDEVSQRSQILTKQINEGHQMMEEIREKEKEFNQILKNLKPLLQTLNKRKAFLSSIFTSSEVQEAKQQIIELVHRGRQICPAYPGFAKFDEQALLRR